MPTAALISAITQIFSLKNCVPPNIDTIFGYSGGLLPMILSTVTLTILGVII